MVSKLQNIAANKIVKSNPSLIWDGIFGYYSNGRVVMNVYWSFDESKNVYQVVLDRDGNQINCNNF